MTDAEIAKAVQLYMTETDPDLGRPLMHDEAVENVADMAGRTFDDVDLIHQQYTSELYVAGAGISGRIRIR